MNVDLEDEQYVAEIKEIVIDMMKENLKESYAAKGQDVEFEFEDLNTKSLLQEMRESGLEITVENLMQVIGERIKKSRVIFRRL